VTLDYKLTVVIIDDFTSRSFTEFSNYDIQYYDYAKTYTSYTGDSYAYYSGFDYGDVDYSGILTDTVSYGWKNVNSLTGLSLSPFSGYTFNRFSDNNPTGYYYGYDPEVIDYTFYDNIDSVNSWTQSSPGHGDWVLKAFTDTLNDRSDVEIVAIDIDYDNPSDLESLFTLTDLNGKTVPFLTKLYNQAINDFHQTGEYHLMVGISASFTYLPALSAIESLLTDDMIIVQSAPNVTSSGINWANYLPNVITVGAWNVDNDGYALAGNINSIDTIDVFANGYIERTGWDDGWSFGTSYATPRVFADIVNFFDSSLLPLLEAGNDTINGGQGIDIIDGGLGNDRLTGGLDSADYFRFSTKLNAKSNLDTITDFVSGVDKIQLSQSIFTKFTGDLVESAQLVSGAGLTAARDTDDYLIFNTTNGALYYDADGNGKAAAVQFATLLGVSSITHEDFMIV